MKKIGIILLSVITGLVFLLSGYSKLFPIEPFEYQLVELGIVNWQLSLILARLIIGFEFYIGALLILNYRLKSFTSRITIFTLFIFSIQLIYILITKGNTTDCGCFGQFFPMTPMQALLKNIILLVISFVIIRYSNEYFDSFKSINFYLFIVSLTSIFIFNSVDFNYSRNYLNKPYENFSLNLDTLYNSNSVKFSPPKLDVRKGKHIVLFLSASCQHCKIAAQKTRIIKKKNSSIPVYYFINGDDKDIDLFIKKTECYNIPYSKLNNPFFVSIAGIHLPVIYYLNNSVVEKQVDYYTLEQYHIENWLNN